MRPTIQTMIVLSALVVLGTPLLLLTGMLGLAFYDEGTRVAVRFEESAAAWSDAPPSIIVLPPPVIPDESENSTPPVPPIATSKPAIAEAASTKPPVAEPSTPVFDQPPTRVPVPKASVRPAAPAQARRPIRTVIAPKKYRDAPRTYTTHAAGGPCRRLAALSFRAGALQPVVVTITDDAADPGLRHPRSTRGAELGKMRVECRPAHYGNIERLLNMPLAPRAKLLKSLALPGGLEPLF